MGARLNTDEQSTPATEKADALPVTRNTPETGLKTFATALPQLFSDLFSKATWTLAGRLIIRNLSAMYRQSVLGYLWLFIPPLAQAGIWVLLQQSGIISFDTGAVPYVVFVLAGQLLWQGFSLAVLAPIQVANAERELLTKLHFPREALIFAAYGQALIQTLVAMLAILPFMLLLGVPLGSLIACVPFSIAVVVAFGVSLGLLATPLALLYQDVTELIPVVLRFLMFLCPVIYPIPASGILRSVHQANPLTPLLEVSRNLLVAGPGEYLGAYGLVALATLLLLLAGFILYRVAMPHVIERMSA